MIRKLALATAFVVAFAAEAHAQGGSIAAYLTRDASGAVATANVYQTVDAYNPATGQTRHGCTIQNTSANPETVRVGATLTFNLAAGANFNCTSGGLVIADTISISSATAGSTYAAGVQ